jgi:WD40 repeat protein
MLGHRSARPGRATILAVLFSATTLLANTAPIRAAPPAPPPHEPHTAPLPAGAVARFGTPLWRLQTEGRRLILSPDNTTLCVGTDYLHVERLDVKTGRRLPPLGSPMFTWGFEVVTPVALSPDSRLVATPDFTRDSRAFPYVSVRRCEDGSESRQLTFARKPEEPPSPTLPKGYTGSSSTRFAHLCAAAFSPDGKTVAGAARFHFRGTISGGGKEEKVVFDEEVVTVGLWNLDSGELRHELTTHTKDVHTIAFSADGKTLTTASRDGTVRFWDVSTGRERGEPLKAGGPIYSAAYSPDRKRLAVGCEKTVLVWEADTGRLLHKLEVPAVGVRAVGFSPDGATLTAAGDTVRLWSSTGKLLGDLEPAIKEPRAVAFAPDGRTVFTAHQHEQRVRRWDAVTRRPLPETEGLSAPARLLTFTPDGKQLLTFTPGEFRLWNPAAGRSGAISGDEPRVMRAMLAASGRMRPMLCDDAVGSNLTLVFGKADRLDQIPGLLGCSADGRRVLVVAERDGKSVLTVREDDKPIREIACSDSEERDATLAPDGKTVATAAAGALSFTDVATGEVRRHKLSTRPATGRAVFACSAVKFSPDGMRVAVLGDKGKVRIVAVADGTLLRELDTGERETGGIAFSPDGKTLLTAVAFGEVSMWELSTGRRIRAEPAGLYQFGPGLGVLASNTEKGLRLVDHHTGALLLACEVPGETASGFAFSPDGRQLAAAYSDCTVVVWDVRAPAPPAEPLDAKRLDQLWTDLEGQNAVRAYAAISALAADPARSLPFLAKRLPPVAEVDAARVAGWIADLGAEDFNTREDATRELFRLGAIAEPAMRAAAKDQADPERRQRLGDLLKVVEKNRRQMSPGELSTDRAVQVLERIGTKDALLILERAAAGAAGAHTTVTARDAVRRLRGPSAP